MTQLCIESKAKEHPIHDPWQIAKPFYMSNMIAAERPNVPAQCNTAKHLQSRQSLAHSVMESCGCHHENRFELTRFVLLMPWLSREQRKLHLGTRHLMSVTTSPRIPRWLCLQTLLHNVEPFDHQPPHLLRRLEFWSLECYWLNNRHSHNNMKLLPADNYAWFPANAGFLENQQIERTLLPILTACQVSCNPG